jgi:two-component system chemotaxis sensor kinase CheA
MTNDKFIETFKEEALELLGNLESTLLELEENPEDKELLSAVFRVMHTIKGSAAMFGLDLISSFAHEVESILSALRDGKLSVSKELIGNTLVSRDLILGMLESGGVTTGPLTPELREFLDQFKESVGFSASIAAGNADAAKKDAQAPAPVVEKKKMPTVWRVHFKPGKDLFRRGTNPLAVINELRNLGESVCIPLFEDVPVLSGLNPEDCLVGWEIYVTTTASENELRDVFIFVEDCSEITIECFDDLIDENTVNSKKLGEILIENGKLERSALDRILQSQKRIGEILVEENLVSPTELKVALEEQKQIQKVVKNKSLAADMSTIRVKSEKLDQLMSLVGELVTIHARILQTSRVLQNSEELVSIVEQFGRLTDELRSNTMSIRMVPIGSTFSSFKRLVRDLSGELGKNVELETDGGETELDKTVIEKLNDPLIHIIRNSLDHGVEMPEVRAERGKPKAGTIRLSASQTGASVYIVIEDDGNGLDKEAILKKAIQKGVVHQDDVLTEQDIFRLIFAPGFSTKEAVTAVSGRGVGMDVVNRQMEMINGSVSIESVERQFTRITLKIPLTLAIIDGLLVKIATECFVIPLSVVVGCLEYIHAKQESEGNIVVFHDHQLPFINMRDFFSISGDRGTIEQIVIVNIKNHHVGLLVDQVIGGNQAVIKPLGKLYKRADGVSSATILGDGSVALILDVEQIVDVAEKAEA